ncbi:hypothetical protein [Duganella violaceipulchra]|uniref:Uncharacterized protein n=1 Tax=Duganella violaceipulchra TaxID=2849652 RepID=A0AA41L5N9_9BURK|nr:hypothetical protein [Duganella violaceicalia]MBV6322437.1 hypothetical protein [Duganella violaceicalia]MCP2010639.1 hypothetical protein [Duganella violaceicalia]
MERIVIKNYAAMGGLYAPLDALFQKHGNSWTISRSSARAAIRPDRCAAYRCDRGASTGRRDHDRTKERRAGTPLYAADSDALAVSGSDDELFNRLYREGLE